MKKRFSALLLGYGLLSGIGGAQAHQIWFEPTSPQALVLRYGEYDKNVLEVTPGGLDRFQALKGWSAQGSTALAQQRDAFSVAHQPAPQDTLLAADLQYPIFELHEQGKNLKAYWTPATRWVGDLRQRQPELDLDIVPTGEASGNTAQFQVFYLRKPLADQNVLLETGSGQVFTQTSDANGNVSFELPWQGTYVVAAEYKVTAPGQRLDAQQQPQSYDVKSYSSTLSFYRNTGQAPLPRAPSQLPASEKARLAKASE
ncbi:DUF4198 domain-containing protein [Pseudomonas sp. PSKL.D1]|uniref:DUF4198 domain-containing protein n=1 Tax=Pseudomonas sp. PSKL.D1 TaxID=3029060 RepID=UPI0023815C8F|nr:DUF4198 domain-containing protein [Pseudomonas sp. PSKL.D1]WDY56791.1 DUF4198 domain-containing protein [Pseudomonas sp. PSKL.D1]